MVLIYNSLMRSDVEHLFMCLLAIWMSFGKVSIHVFCLFLHWIIYILGVEFSEFFIDFARYVSNVHFLKSRTGASRWLSRSSGRLLISAHVMILGSWD